MINKLFSPSMSTLCLCCAAFVVCLTLGCDGDSSDATYQKYSDLKSSEPTTSESAAETTADQKTVETDPAADVLAPATQGNDLLPANSSDPTTADSTPTTAATPPSANKSRPPRQPLVAPLPVAETEVLMAQLPADEPEPIRIPEVLVPEKEFQTVSPEAALKVTYDDLDLLRVINLEPVTPDGLKILPTWFKLLDGQRIRIRGIMIPPFTDTELTRFGLARDEQACCFGINAKVYHVIDVRLRDGHNADYFPGQYFDVVGVFHLRPDAEDDKVISLYEIDDAIVVR